MLLCWGSCNKLCQPLDVACGSTPHAPLSHQATSHPPLHSVVCGGCRGPWNIFDFLMVLAGYTAFIPMGGSSSGGGGGGSSAAAIRALRALRALRPLRTITRFESLRSIVVCFLEVGAGCWGQGQAVCEHIGGRRGSLEKERQGRQLRGGGAAHRAPLNSSGPFAFPCRRSPC